MAKVHFSRHAREDLLDIWLYVAQPNSTTVADRVYDRVEELCGLLRDHRQLGPARPDIAPDARMLVMERWLALYRLIDDGVQIVRIVDGSRDLARIEWSVVE